MRAIRYHETGGPDRLHVEDVPRPTPGEDEILVDVHATSVNPLEIRFRSGRYPADDFPITPGVDFAGEVAAVGPGVRGFAVGDRVFGDGLDKGGPYQGAMAEYAVAPTSLTTHLPDAVGFEAAAAVGHVGLTAWMALLEWGRPQPGDTVLVQGGSGGVGHVAVQLATLAGATVVATAGDAAKRRRVRELGAEEVVDYRDDPASDLRAACESLGAPSVILDHRLHDYLALDIELAGEGARIVTIAGDDVSFSNTSTGVSKGLSIHFSGSTQLDDIPGTLDRLAALLASGRLTVDVGRRFPLEEAAAAHRAVEEESVLGKVVVTIG